MLSTSHTFTEKMGGMVMGTKLKMMVYGIVICLCMMPFFTPALALVCGMALACLGWQLPALSKYASLILQGSIVLMGFGMNVQQVITTTQQGFYLTASSIVFTLLAGYLATRLLKIEHKTGLLIASGTAICGGSAIAAIAPVIDAKDSQISIALVVVFVLNAVALFLFPFVGHCLHLNEMSFGYWSAIAIHDTSSVVGAGAAYGSEALKIATTVKLTRALWIIPVSVLFTFMSPEASVSKIKIPWFILLFIGGIVIAQFLPQWHNGFQLMSTMGQRGLVAALFLVGSNIVMDDIKTAGRKSFILGIVLWLMIGTLSLLWLMS